MSRCAQQQRHSAHHCAAFASSGLARTTDMFRRRHAHATTAIEHKTVNVLVHDGLPAEANGEN
jgi:hypothetical protein